jgi:hypothetical protein
MSRTGSASSVSGSDAPATAPRPSSDASAIASAAPHCTTESSGTATPSTVRVVCGFTPIAWRSVVSETCRLTNCCMPSPSESTATSDATPMTMPSVERKVRNGLARSVAALTRNDIES